jgi:hypothetical protein
MTTPILLLTDFGPHSAYVGQLELVLAGLAPLSRVIHVAHDLPPQDLRAASLVLATCWAHVPPGPAVLCAVVDPGVGSDRRPLAVDLGGGRYAVGPDNGLLLAAGPPRAAVTLAPPTPAPSTRVFHGRDVFAPAAARLATGAALERLGAELPTAQLVAPVGIEDDPGCPEVMYVDPFGSLVTTLRCDELPGDATGVEIGGRRVPLLGHYAEAPSGALLALCGSFGRVEIACRDGSAAAALGVGVGARVTLLDSHGTALGTAALTPPATGRPRERST